MTLPSFEMTFEPMTIEHLGLRLYSRLPPVISEFVTNAYDAESPKVEIVLPQGDIQPTSEVVVRDWGHAMSPRQIQEEFLPIGRNRRGEDSANAWSRNRKRKVTGRKGLGKLSAFGIAREMDLKSVQNGTSLTLRFNYDKMLEWARNNPGNYKPEIVDSSRTQDPNGVEIRMRQLRRTTQIDPEALRKSLARRLKLIRGGFQVVVNGTAVGPKDRLGKDDCQFAWTLSETELGTKLASWTLSGWIGFLEESSQANRGIDIFANEKAAELGSYFNFPSTHAQFARAHLIGEISADFLDAKDDLVATARNSVVWESVEGQQLQIWGQSLLRWAFDQWIELRRKEKKEKLTKTAGFDKWVESRPEREQKVAQRMVKLLVDDERIETPSAVSMLEIVKSSVETMAFRELLDTLEEEPPTVGTLLKLFHEWRIIEAREHLQMADGRTSAIDQLHRFIDSGALEVQQLQPLLVENLWLLDPAWSEANEQTTYSNLLRKNCKEPTSLDDIDRRLDIIGVTESSSMTVVEIKRPEKTLSLADLNQVEQYVDWARDNILGQSDYSPKYIRGLLIVGQRNAKHQAKVARLAGSDIHVATYRDLHTRASRHYSEIERKLESLAPEYTKAKRKAKGKKQ